MKLCNVCGIRERVTRLRCDVCIGVHVNGTRGPALVHPTMPYELDEAAQRFVDEHPDGGSLDEIGEAMGLTRERIRQIESIALRRLSIRLPLAGIDPEDAAEYFQSKARRRVA